MKRRGPHAPASFFNVDDFDVVERLEEDEQKKNNDDVMEGIVMPMANDGVLITDIERKYFERIDRLNGKASAAKKQRSSPSSAEPASGSNKTKPASTVYDDDERRYLAKQHRFDQPFTTNREASEAVFDAQLNELIPKMLKSRLFTTNDAIVQKMLYRGEDTQTTHRRIPLTDSPVQLPNGPLQYIAPVLRPRLIHHQTYDHCELFFRPIDIRWSAATYTITQQVPSGTNHVSYPIPSGFALDIANTARYLDSNTQLAVWSLDIILPTALTQEHPAWIPILLSQWFNRADLRQAIDFVGIAGLDTIVDAEALFQCRFVFVYIVLKDTASFAQHYRTEVDARHRYPWITRQQLDSMLGASGIKEGETNVTLDRQKLMLTDETNILFKIPFIYAGRYYFSPTPASKFPLNALQSRLKDAQLLWNLMPVFNDYEKRQTEETQRNQEAFEQTKQLLKPNKTTEEENMPIYLGTV